MKKMKVIMLVIIALLTIYALVFAQSIKQKLKNLNDTELSKTIKESILDVNDDDLRLQNVKEIQKLIKERKTKKLNISEIKKFIKPKFLKILNESQNNNTLTQDVATILIELNIIGISDTEKIRIKRVQIFNVMKWREGKFKTKKEKDWHKNLFKKQWRPDIFYQSKWEGDMDTIRPLTEYIFNLSIPARNRQEAVGALGRVKSKKTILIFKKLMTEENEEIQVAVANSLYNLGEKELALNKMVELCERGVIIAPQIFFPINPKTRMRNNYDSIAKPYLLKIINFKNNPAMQIMSAYYLYKLGEETIAIATKEKVKTFFEENKSKVKKREYNLIERYLRRFK